MSKKKSNKLHFENERIVLKGGLIYLEEQDVILQKTDKAVIRKNQKVK